MKKFVVLALLFFPFNAFSQLGMEKDRLTTLLKQRKDTFEIYFESIERRSGIFGNQTKGDLKKVNEILTDIVKTDNTIFKELQRLLAYEKFEKKAIGSDAAEYESKVRGLIAANDTLTSQVEMLRTKTSKAEHQNEVNEVLRNIFGFIALLLVIFIVVKKRGSVSS